MTGKRLGIGKSQVIEAAALAGNDGDLPAVVQLQRLERAVSGEAHGI